MVWRDVRTAALLLLAVSLVEGTATPTAAGSSRTYTNPVYKHDFADPYVLKVGKIYYAYSTNTPVADIPTLHSTDLVHWKAGKDAFPAPPRWVATNIWAPHVFRRRDGQYVMYFSARDTSSDRQCLGWALSKAPGGPFISRAASPSLCQVSQGGDIDPAVFQDSKGNLYLLWKNDGNCCGLTTYIWSQRLAADGTTLQGQPVQLDKNGVAWEGNLIEAPFMWQRSGKYYLFFSANNYASPSYAVGYAVCKTPLGPCTDSPHNPMFFSRCKAAGPGGETIVKDARGQTWMLYHAWLAGHINDPNVGRVLWLDRLNWKKSGPVVTGPTCNKQTAPAV